MSFLRWRGWLRQRADLAELQLIVARKVHHEVPGHRLDAAQRLVDQHALHAADDARHAVRRIADEGTDAADRAVRTACEDLGVEDPGLDALLREALRGLVR